MRIINKIQHANHTNMALMIPLPGVFGDFEDNDTQRIISGDDDDEIVRFIRGTLWIDPSVIISTNDTSLEQEGIGPICLARTAAGSVFFLEMRAERLVEIINKTRILNLHCTLQ